jgi:hypothetical protein
MPKQVSLKINTSFIETKPAGLATKYLKSGEIDLRMGIELAISCLFAPIGAAVNGATRSEVETMIASSRTQFELCLTLALSRCQDKSEGTNQGGNRFSKALISNNHEEELDLDDNINFDDEEIEL